MGILKVKTSEELGGAASKSETYVSSGTSDSSSDEDFGNVPASVDTSKAKTKVMILSSRGINARQRHLLDDLISLMPHFKKESKFDSKKDLFELNELSELNGCSHVVFFEARKPQELFMWLSKCPNGPSVRFHVENIHTMDELNLKGNSMKNIRPILTFAPDFNRSGELKEIKNLLTQIFGVPKDHKKVRPYVDRVMHFGWSDDRIWARNYQITSEVDGKLNGSNEGFGLEEIGPRFILHPIISLERSFSGRVIWKNPNYISSSALRSSVKMGMAAKQRQKSSDQKASTQRKRAAILPNNSLEDIFE